MKLSALLESGRTINLIRSHLSIPSAKLALQLLINQDGVTVDIGNRYAEPPSPHKDYPLRTLKDVTFLSQNKIRMIHINNFSKARFTEAVREFCRMGLSDNPITLLFRLLSTLWDLCPALKIDEGDLLNAVASEIIKALLLSIKDEAIYSRTLTLQLLDELKRRGMKAPELDTIKKTVQGLPSD